MAVAWQRWLVLGVGVLLVVLIGLGAWKVSNTTNELQKANQAVVNLKEMLSRTESSLAAANRSLALAKNTTTTTTSRLAPFPYVDESQLLADLGRAYTASTGFYFSTANPTWVNTFVNAFTAEERNETDLADEGKPYYIPDPVSEANAYVANGTIP